MHRFFKDRVAWRRKGRRVKRTHCDSADRGVAVPFPIEGGAATRTKMKSDAVTAVGIALVDLPLAVEPHPLFGIRRTEVESRAGAPLARLAVAEVNPTRLTCGNYSKRATVALTGLFHRIGLLLVAVRGLGRALEGSGDDAHETLVQFALVV